MVIQLEIPLEVRRAIFMAQPPTGKVMSHMYHLEMAKVTGAAGQVLPSHTG